MCIRDRLDDAALDAHVSRIVRAAAAVPGFLDDKGCAPGSCQEELYATNATSSEHRALARDLAADSVVMLKNEDVLPLTPGSRIAVVGGACDAYHDAETLMKRWDLGDYYVVGGSGRVVAHGPPTTAILPVSGSTPSFLSMTTESAAKSRASALCSGDVAFVAYSSSWQEPGTQPLSSKNPGTDAAARTILETCASKDASSKLPSLSAEYQPRGSPESSTPDPGIATSRPAWY